MRSEKEINDSYILDKVKNFIHNRDELRKMAMKMIKDDNHITPRAKSFLATADGMRLQLEAIGISVKDNERGERE